MHYTLFFHKNQVNLAEYSDVLNFGQKMRLNGALLAGNVPVTVTSKYERRENSERHKSVFAQNITIISY